MTKNKYLTVVVNGIPKNSIVITGSPISIIPADESKLEETELRKVKRRYQIVNMNEVKFRGRIPADFEYASNKKKMQTLNTERNDITQVLKMDCLKKFNLTTRNNRLDESNQSKKGTSD